jgi:hypothetical protein
VTMRQIAIDKIKSTYWYSFLTSKKIVDEIPVFSEKSDSEILDLLVFAEIWSHDQETHAGYRF